MKLSFSLYSCLFFLLLILHPDLSLSTTAQSQEDIEKLITQLRQEKDASKKAILYNEVARGSASIDLAMGERYAVEGIAFAKKEGLRKELGTLYNAAAVVRIFQGNNTPALAYMDSAITIFTEIDDKSGLANSLGNKGRIYYMIGNYSQALELQLRCLKTNEALNDKSEIATALANVLGIYYVQKDFKRALEVGYRALSLYNEVNELDGLALISYNLASVHLELNALDSAYYYANKTIDFFGKMNNFEGIADGNRILSDVFRKQKKFDLALEKINAAIPVYKEIGGLHKQAEALSSLGMIYLDQKRYAECIPVADEYLRIAREIQTPQFERDALKLLMECHQGLGQYKEAMMYANRYIPLRDSILNEENMRAQEELKTIFETEKKEQENEALKLEGQLLEADLQQQKYYILVLIIAIGLITALGFILFRQNKIVAKTRTVQLEQRLLRTQMNPHFIFNSLTAIQSFVYKSDPRQAGKFLSSFATLVRAILDNSREEYISLTKELKWLENYLELQKLRFENRFEYHIHIDENVIPENIEIPPMLTQPFIENALEHGFRNITYLGKLDIYFELKGEKLEVNIRDNGIGLSTETQLTPSNHVSHAIPITKERLLLLNKNKKEKIIFSMESNDGQGVSVRFTVPLES